MVKKLFKHELLSYARLLFPIYGILLMISVFTRATQLFESDSTIYHIICASSWIFFVIAIVVAIVLTTVFIIVRFYKNLFSGEGYLTLTLPFTPSQHIRVKLLTAVLVEFVTGLLVLLSILIVTEWDVLNEIGKALTYLIDHIPQKWQDHLPLFVIEILILLVVSIFSNYLMYYTCISVGQLSKKNRVLAAVGVYFIIYFIYQAIGTAFGIAMAFLTETPLLDNITTFCENHPIGAIHIGFTVTLVIELAVTAAYYLITRHILCNKLNLE